MECPRCSLENPSSAVRCDCGYDFPSGQMQAPIPTGKTAETPPHVDRLAGWLALPAVGLFLTVVAAILGFHEAVSDSPSRFNMAVAPASRFDIAVAAVWLTFVLFVAWSFFRRKRRAPILVILLLGINVVITMVTAHASPSAARGVDLTEYSGLFRASLVAGIWIPYFLKSRRVKLTFVR